MEIIETIIAPKIGTGTREDPFRPDTMAETWGSIEVTETTFTIQIYAEG